MRQVPPVAARPVIDENPFASPPPGQAQRPTSTPSYGGISATPSEQPATLQPSNQQAPPPSYARDPQQTVPPSALGSFSPTSGV